MIAFVTVLHVLVCVFLILVILLQAGKGGSGLGFGMAGSQTVFGARGSQTFLGKVTSACAAIFFSTCIILSFTASYAGAPRRGKGGADGGTMTADAGVTTGQTAPSPGMGTATAGQVVLPPKGATEAGPGEGKPEQPKP